MASTVQKPDYKALAFDAINRQIDRVMDAKGGDLSSLCKRWGVTPPRDFVAPAPLRDVGLEELAAMPGMKLDGIVRCAETLGLPAGEVKNYEQSLAVDYALEGLSDEEVGRPGTPFSGYLPRNERTSRLSPYRARGIANSPGIYEEHGKEPICYKNLQSIKEFLVNTERWSIPVPEDCPEEMREEVKAACDIVWGALQGIEGGWERFCEDAASAWQFGFAPFEIVWGTVKGYTLPVKLAYREASSVKDWLLDAHERSLAAIRFQPGGQSGGQYVLPVTGQKLTDHRVLLNVVGRRGLNFEGVPPTRVCDVLIAKKKLLLTMEAVCAERFGGPILTQYFDPSGLMEGTSLDDGDWQAVFDLISHMEAKDTLAITLAPGIRLAYVSPVGTPPQFQQQLEYIDKQIALVWSNQGALLGMTGHGSHALASVQENDLLRSAPYYARLVTRHLNELLRKIFIQQFDLELCTYPRLRWDVTEEQDTGEWLEQMERFYAIADRMDVQTRAMAAKKLGITEDFEDTKDDTDDVPGVLEGESAIVPVGGVEKAQDAALNGAQIASMVEVAMAVKGGTLERNAAIQIIMTSLPVSRDEAEVIVGRRAAPSSPAAESLIEEPV